MEEKLIVADNIKRLREANGYTQESVAGFLGVKRSAYANYEVGCREIPYAVMEKLSDLYGCDMLEFYSEDKMDIDNMLVTAFRVDELAPNDMEQIAAFKRIVKNSLKMDKMLLK
ncbi:MAG: helix-turn-helix transcriptional regulator [Bacteroidales bacterium]|nr:helix-turn-helix transcriptional regulator [Bacteroidales bacterium]